MSSKTPTCWALIPARAGSKRIPNKNVKLLGGHPLLAYTIRAAIDSGIFARIIVSTDSRKIADIAKKYGVEVPFLRPVKFAGDHSPDMEWVKHLLGKLFKEGDTVDCFSILRPTSPFRQPETIRRAWRQFLSDNRTDSLRAVEKCKQHPAKMWRVDFAANRMKPVLVNPAKHKVPWHSMQYQSLPEIYVQNASLEMTWCKTIFEKSTIAGDAIMPFFTKGHEGFDINTPEDWVVAEHMIKENPNILAKINV
ncbi:MAG: acylneuraminate cytidylyltransferase family protein [Candidatus Yanofskybacteria bacterium]|nr:acylneuraminate cytidylyltransferase family protein [Candidatus Yanofskybacteria bacterium]